MSEHANGETPSTEDLGNTIDGSRPGDGGSAPAGGGAAGGAAGGGSDAHEAEREEQKSVYSTPDPEDDRAVGGSEGTADGR